MNYFDMERALFVVVRNGRGDHALWPHWKSMPAGWSQVQGIVGDKSTVQAALDRLLLAAHDVAAAVRSACSMQPVDVEVDSGAMLHKEVS